MRHPVLWQQGTSFPAAEDRGLFATLWPGGGVSGALGAVVPGTMDFTVAPGSAAVPLQDGTVALCRWDAPETVTLAPAPAAGSQRFDAVIVRVRDTALDAGADNDFILTTITGEASPAGPVLPTLGPNDFQLFILWFQGGEASLDTAGFYDRRLSLGPYRRQYSRGYNVPAGAIQGICPTSTPPFFMTSANEQAMTFLVPCLVSVIVKVDCPGDDWLQVTHQTTDQAFRAIMNWGGGYNVTGVFHGYVAPDESVNVLSVVGAAGMHNSHMTLTVTPCVAGIRQGQTGAPTTRPAPDDGEELPEAKGDDDT